MVSNISFWYNHNNHYFIGIASIYPSCNIIFRTTNINIYDVLLQIGIARQFLSNLYLLESNISIKYNYERKFMIRFIKENIVKIIFMYMVSVAITFIISSFFRIIYLIYL